MRLLRSIGMARGRLEEAESRRAASAAAAALMATELDSLRREVSSTLADVETGEARLMTMLAGTENDMSLELERLLDTSRWLESTMAEVTLLVCPEGDCGFVDIGCQQ